LFYTSDYGKSWKRLVDEKKVYGYCLSIVQDFVEPNLLFLGTEFGLYVSTDFGKNWTKWKSDFPTVSTTDLIIHPRENDLVIGTFGRSIYIIDNIAPLREIAKYGNKFFETDLKLFDIPDTYLMEFNSPKGMRFPGHAEFYGENLPRGAMITFQVKSSDTDTMKEDTSLDEKKSSETVKVKLEIYDEKYNLIRTLNVKAKDGVNRTYWYLDRKGVRIPRWEDVQITEEVEPSGPEVLPGKYLVKISYKNFSDSSYVNVLPDPRLKIAFEDLKIREEAIQKFSEKMKVVENVINKLKKADRNLKFILDKLSDQKDDKYDGLKKLVKANKDSIKTLAELFFFTDTKGIQSDPDKIIPKLWRTQNYLLTSYDRPSQMFELSFNDFSKSLEDAVKIVNEYFQSSWMNLVNEIKNSGVSLIDSFEPVEFKK